MNRYISNEDELLREYARYFSSHNLHKNSLTDKSDSFLVLNKENAKKLANEKNPICSEIKEKSQNNSLVPVNCPIGFPKPFKLASYKLLNKTSLFAQNLSNFKSDVIGLSPRPLVVDTTCTQECLSTDGGLLALDKLGPKIVTCSSFLDSRTEAFRIHDENIKRLSKLTTDEILEYKEHILGSIDSKLLAYLIQDMKKPWEDYGHLRNDFPSVSKTLDTSSSRIIENIEAEKLQWTTDLPFIAKKTPNILKNEKNSVSVQARFDFNGLIVPDNLETTTKFGLHHHGEDPEKAGYSISELFHLSRSSMLSQRHIALATLTQCLKMSCFGCHVPNLSRSLMCSLIDIFQPDHPDRELNSSAGGLIFLLRWCIDEAVSDFAKSGASGISMSIVCDCFEALESVLYDEIDESVLENFFKIELYLYSKMMPSLSAPSSLKTMLKSQKSYQSHEKIYELKAYSYLTIKSSNQKMSCDHNKSMQIDPIKCLVKQTQLCKRIAWLLNLKEERMELPQQLTHIWIPKILIRIARHSQDLSYEIFKTPNLVKALFEIGFKNPNPNTIKLFRVLAQSSSSNSLCLIKDFQIMDPLFKFVFSSCMETLLIKFESLKCLITLVIRSKSTQIFETFEKHGTAFKKSFFNDFRMFLEDSSPSILSKVVECWLILISKLMARCIDYNCLEEILEYLEKFMRRFLSIYKVKIIDATPSCKEIQNSMQKFDLNVAGAMIDLSNEFSKNNLLIKKMNNIRIQIEALVNSNFAFKILDYFQNNESFLTGKPEKLFDISQVIHKSYPKEYLQADIESSENNAQLRPAYHEPEWESIQPEEKIDFQLCEPIPMHPSCLPGLGLSTFYRHEHFKGSSLRAYIWPPVEIIRPVISKQGIVLTNHRTRILPFFYSIIFWAQNNPTKTLFEKLLNWLEMFCSKTVFPWKNSFSVEDPFLSIHIELHMMIQILKISLKQVAVACSLIPIASYKIFSLLNGYDVNSLNCVLSMLEQTALNKCENSEIPNLPFKEPEIIKYAFEMFARHLKALSNRDFLNESSSFTTSSSKNDGYLDHCYLSLCGDKLVPKDWLFAPYIWSYFSSQALKDSKFEDATLHKCSFKVFIGNIELHEIQLLTIFLTKTIVGRNLLQASRTDIPTLSCLSYIICALIASFDHFIPFGYNLTEEPLSLLLKDIFNENIRNLVSKDPYLDNVSIPLQIPSFYDLWVQYLTSYAAASYGSTLLASIVLFPCRYNYPFSVKFRRTLWAEEHVSTLTTLSVKPNDENFLLSLDGFFNFSDEEDEGVIRSMASVLFSGKITLERQPLIALWAIHHLNRFLYNRKNENSKLLMQIALLLKMTNKTISAPAEASNQKRLPINSLIFKIICRYKKPRFITDSINPTSYFELYEELPSHRKEMWKKLIE